MDSEVMARKGNERREQQRIEPPGKRDNFFREVKKRNSGGKRHDGVAGWHGKRLRACNNWPDTFDCPARPLACHCNFYCIYNSL